MKSLLILIAVLSGAISFTFGVAGCVQNHRPRGSRMDSKPSLASTDYSLTVGDPGRGYPSLVRVKRDGIAVFTVWGEKPFEVEAGPGEQIPEGDSDFYGFVVSSDPRSQSVIIRSYDLGSPIDQVTEQAASSNH